MLLSIPERSKQSYVSMKYTLIVALIGLVCVLLLILNVLYRPSHVHYRHTPTIRLALSHIQKTYCFILEIFAVSSLSHGPYHNFQTGSYFNTSGRSFERHKKCILNLTKQLLTALHQLFVGLMLGPRAVNRPSNVRVRMRSTSIIWCSPVAPPPPTEMTSVSELNSAGHRLTETALELIPQRVT